jgi:hypothetical protein
VTIRIPGLDARAVAPLNLRFCVGFRLGIAVFSLSRRIVDNKTVPPIGTAIIPSNALECLYGEQRGRAL